jgi:hypothetical protein
MIEDIIALKDRGYTVKEIADQLDLSVGKIQYRLRKKKALETQQQMNRSPFKISKSIPEAYEIDRIVAMPQGPHCVYAYWDVQSTTQHMVEHHFCIPWTDLQKKLRIHDVSDLHFNGHNSHCHTTIELPEMTNNWFIRPVEENRTYVIDFGVGSNVDEFFTIIRSAPVETPREGTNSGRHREPLEHWQSGNGSSPQWYEQFSTYSVYGLIK